MTINRQWIAREWLYLLAGFLWAFLSPILLRRYANLLTMFGPYVIFQVVRITMWAIRTVREGK